MRGFTHAAIGMAAYTGTVKVGIVPADSLLTLPGLLVAIFSSGLPDIDAKTTDHRGFTHSLMACVIIGVLAGLLCLNKPWAMPICVAFFIGYVSHIVADMFTDNGVCLLWPSYKRRTIVKLWNYSEGGLFELAISGVLFSMLVVYWGKYIWNL